MRPSTRFTPCHSTPFKEAHHASIQSIRHPNFQPLTHINLALSSALPLLSLRNPRDVCSTGTHKYVDCPIHVEPGTAANLDLDQGLDYIVFYDLTTGESTE